MTDSAESSEISCSPLRPPYTTATRVFISKNLLPHRREDQFDGQIGGAVYLVYYRIHFDDLHRQDTACVARHFHRKMRLAVSRAAANGRSHARRVFRIDEIHVDRKMKSRRPAGHDADGLIHHRAHAAFVDIAHGERTH